MLMVAEFLVFVVCLLACRPILSDSNLAVLSF